MRVCVHVGVRASVWVRGWASNFAEMCVCVCVIDVCMCGCVTQERQVCVCTCEWGVSGSVSLCLFLTGVSGDICVAVEVGC